MTYRNRHIETDISKPTSGLLFNYSIITSVFNHSHSDMNPDTEDSCLDLPGDNKPRLTHADPGLTHSWSCYPTENPRYPSHFPLGSPLPFSNVGSGLVDAPEEEQKIHMIFSITPVLLYNPICTIEKNINSHSRSCSSTASDVGDKRLSCFLCLDSASFLKASIMPILDSLHRPLKSEFITVTCRPPNAFQPSAYN